MAIFIIINTLDQSFFMIVCAFADREAIRHLH